MDLEAGVRALRVGAAAVAMIGQLVSDEPDVISRKVEQVCSIFAEALRPIGINELHRRVPVLSPQILSSLAEAPQEGALSRRFRPRSDDGVVRYRPCDLLELLQVLGKHEDESWAQWSAREAYRDIPPGSIPGAPWSSES
jgi:hypothetical protein